MFAPFPGFENLSLRVTVQWQGRARPIVARLERWPDSDKAVIVCSFEDDESAGEWLMVESENIYRLGAPDRLLARHAIYDIATRAPQGWSKRGQNRLHALAQRAFDNLVVTSVYLLPAVSAPNIVIVETNILHWCRDLQRSSFVPFEMCPKLSTDARQAQSQLESAWQDRESDAHFAWRWASYRECERVFLLTDYDDDRDDMEQVMKWVLQRMSNLWLLESGWTWNLGAGEGELWSKSGKIRIREANIETWSWLLRRHFFPELNHLLRREHPCVQELWAKRVRDTRVELTAPPTAHEQLESHLWLRDWLEDKATPEQTKILLAVLDEPLIF